LVWKEKLVRSVRACPGDLVSGECFQGMLTYTNFDQILIPEVLYYLAQVFVFKTDNLLKSVKISAAYQ
jgi:hypothetical protein